MTSISPASSRTLRQMCVCALFLFAGLGAASQSAETKAAPARRNVIIFVADGLRRGSVTAEDMPTFLRLRREGVDFRNSHSVFPTFTTANASAIATGHGLGDTGDYGNVLYPGFWLAPANVPAATGSIAPFLEDDGILADLNSHYDGNYLHEQTLLSAAHAAGFDVASVGKLGPVAIQQIDVVGRDPQGAMLYPETIIVDDSTGHADGVPLPVDVSEAIANAGLMVDAPLRNNGYDAASQGNNGNSGDAVTPGTKIANITQQQWFTDVTTRVLLPRFVADAKPFVLLFWSRDPDGTQHNQGDSLQQLEPGINGDTSRQALRNADHCLRQLLEWLDKNPAIKANTDVLVTSDHGFATLSRREVNSKQEKSHEVSANLTYGLMGKEKAQPLGTLPTGFLAIDLAVHEHMRVFDPALRASAGDSVYAEVMIGGDASQHPTNGSALLGDVVKQLDGSDARLIVASNGGSDLIYAPGKDAALVKKTIETLTALDYVGGIFVDDAYCATPADCPGTLPMSLIGLEGASPLPRPAIAVTYKVFNLRAGDLQSAVQLSDSTLQEGQGQHGGFGRDSTWNNMAAIGPDFKREFVDEAAFGNIDIAPTVAALLGLEMPSHGTLRGRAAQEAMMAGSVKTSERKIAVSAPAANGMETVLEYQEQDGVRYFDQACFVKDAKTQTCPL